MEEKLFNLRAVMCQTEASEVEPKNWGRIESRPFGAEYFRKTRIVPRANHSRGLREGHEHEREIKSEEFS